MLELSVKRYSLDAQNGASYRILTVSKGCVAVTAPQAAMPPAINALRGVRFFYWNHKITDPKVVAMLDFLQPSF
jgi:hypothetical protein